MFIYKRNILPFKKVEDKLYLFDRIILIAQRWQDEADRIIQERMGLTLRQWMLLLLLYEDFKDHLPAVSEAAERFGTSRQNIKRLALELQKKGFIIIIHDLKDQRIQRFALTGKHRRFMEGEENAAWQMSFMNHFFREMNDEEIQCLMLGINKIMKAIPTL